MCARVFAQAEQRIFCTAKLQLNAIAICDAQARTRELGSSSCPPSLPWAPLTRGVSTNRPKKPSNARQRRERERRQRTKKRTMTHMCIYAKPETDTTGRKGMENGGGGNGKGVVDAHGWSPRRNHALHKFHGWRASLFLRFTKRDNICAYRCHRPRLWKHEFHDDCSRIPWFRVSMFISVSSSLSLSLAHFCFSIDSPRSGSRFKMTLSRSERSRPPMHWPSARY